MINTGQMRVAIIGAGASGIAAARQALDYGVEPTIFELSDECGGLWRFKPTETEEGSVMKSTVINTSKEMTAFSDFPPPPEFPNYMHNRKLLEYFQCYVKTFKLESRIRYKHRVKNVYRSPTYQTTGKWMVSFQNEKNDDMIEEYDAILLCTGHHTTPSMPTAWPGQDRFHGRITHAHSFKDFHGYENKVVAVVGVGNSGVDVAVELSRVAKQVYLVSRRGTWILYRNTDYGMPLDLAVNTRIFTAFFNCFPLWIIEKVMRRDLEKRFNHEKYGLSPAHGLFGAHFTLNDELQNRLCCGTVIVKPNIRSFTENGAIFEDNSVVEQIDDVICSTGYRFNFSIVENGNLIPVENNRVNSLYKFMFPMATSDHNTLAVIGLIQPIGSIMPISEMQARVFFESLTKQYKMPNEVEMRRDIDHKIKDMDERYVKSPRHTIQVDYVTYMDELAELIGCKPSIWQFALTDPILAWKLLVGPNTPYVYRLCGPKKWENARQTIMRTEERVECGMRNVKSLNNKNNNNTLANPLSYCKNGLTLSNNALLLGTVGLIILFLWMNFAPTLTASKNFNKLN